MSEIDKDIKFYNKIQDKYENGTWLLIHNQEFVSIHDSFEKAAEEAVRLFGAGPYLIRQVGAHPLVLPASVVFNIHHSA